MKIYTSKQVRRITKSLRDTLCVAFKRIYAEMAGGPIEGLLLTQILYWADVKENDNDGWFYKSQEDWYREIMINRYQLEKARKKLVDIGILETKKEGIPCRIYYRLKEDEFIEALDKTSRETNYRYNISQDVIDAMRASLDPPYDYEPKPISNPHGSQFAENNKQECEQREIKNAENSKLGCRVQQTSLSDSANNLYTENTSENTNKENKRLPISPSEKPQHPDPELGREKCSVVNDFSEGAESSQEGVQNLANVQTHTEAPGGASKVQKSANENTDGVPLEVEVIESYEASNNQNPSTALTAQQEVAQTDAVDVEVTTIQNSGAAATEEPIQHDSLSSTATTLSTAYGGTTNKPIQHGSSSSTTDSHSLATNNIPGVGQNFRPHKSAKNPRTGQKYYPWEGTVLYRNRWVSGVNPEFIVYVIMRNKNAKIKHFMSMKGSELIRATEKWMGPRANEVEKLWYDFVDGVDVNSNASNISLKQIEFEANRAKRIEWLKNMA